jgi:hypothetical protein
MNIDADIVRNLLLVPSGGTSKRAQGNIERDRRRRQGGARRLWRRSCRRRRGQGYRSDRIDLRLKGAMKEMGKIGDKDEGDEYQGGVDDD